MPTGKIVLEKTIVANILKYLNSIPGCHAEKVHGGEYGVAGKPDITGCIDGQRMEIEVKRPGGALTPRQAAGLQLWWKAGALCAAVSSLAHVQRIMGAVAFRSPNYRLLTTHIYVSSDIKLPGNFPLHLMALMEVTTNEQ